MSRDPVHAVLAPPDLARFRELTGVGDAELDVSFGGWSKLALLAEDRVFLFPRRGHEADLLHGARMSEVLSAFDLPCVPRLLGTWNEPAGPFAAYERRRGTDWQLLEATAGLDDVERMLRSLGGAIATWHRIERSALPPEIGDARLPTKQPWLTAFLDPNRVEDAVDQAASLLNAKPAWASTWRRILPPLAHLEPVLVHGDVCENQLLVDADGRVDTVLDWDTAGIGHPLHDFDFGEWGFGIFAWEGEFARLRRALWETYRAGRPGMELPGADEVHLLFTLSELAYFEEGTRDEWGERRLARGREAIGPATEAFGG